ncbi:LON peptidase substrate-binding domain-containing protein [Roseospira visakhapatnamensis]|uniref:Lon N-terminal domain-containing protein n=1 Tax=Roseospira visakhapatnamensis TaxID=390880 RepID=A0A7W6WA75_9PROT|nr:LON peptidase substrate-binding domain-containing protein [Roseospira visakhapatnamensis]MBB4266689.1 hypothetical protein [Roseospira visakhapatnamensis]
MLRSFQPRFEDLPAVVPVFPLTGVLLLPGGRLPLNVFEPRYLNMIEDTLGQGRMLAMVQPREDSGEALEAAPALYSVACLGRIVSFEEAPEGRLLITLLGLSRFRVRDEEPLVRGYRRVGADYSAFENDLADPGAVTIDRDRLFSVLQPFATRRGLNFNWDLMREVESRPLVTALAMICPFEPREKQAILEAVTLQERADLLLALLEMGAIESGDNGRQRQ